METPQLDDGRIENAMKAYATLTPDSITSFRELSDIEAVVVIRVLRTTNPVKPRRRDAGVSRKRATETKA